ncbi:MAG: hypothetical protein KatS3mg105_3724 [Gemmatales bacterium]|nr:MAG: hypothetical protein KatS3mg105_3724 [Gemmatales bacterium]
MNRRQWTDLSDDQLLAECEVDTYRASGPGGQKRNKTSSAVRLRHLPSGTIVIAEESRSQHENRARALKRLRQALYLNIREELSPAELSPKVLSRRPELAAVLREKSRLAIGRKDSRFWPAVGVVLDVLEAVQGRLRDAAEALGVSTANLVDFLSVDSKVWQQANRLRARHGHKPLKTG